MKRQEAIKKLHAIKDKNLHELAKQYEVPVYRNGKVNKGWAGQTIERYLGLPINSSRCPNFGSWELKVIPLKRLKNGQQHSTRRMADCFFTRQQ